MTERPSSQITAEVVRLLFRRYWPEPKPIPDEWSCNHVAIALQVICDRKPPPTPETTPDAIKYGGLFVRHAASLEARLWGEASLYCYTAMEPGGEQRIGFHDKARYDKANDAIRLFQEAVALVEKALDAFKERDFLYLADRDPAIFMYEITKFAWISSDLDLPRSIEEDSATCQFVADALELTNIRVGQGRTKGAPYGPAAISAVLKERNEGLNFIRV